MRRQASRDEESSGTKWDNIFSTKSQRFQEGESTKSVRKVITDYAYAYSICTHGGGDGERDEKLLYIYNKKYEQPGASIGGCAKV